MIFSAKLGSLRKGFKKEIDFTFIRAPHKVPSQDETGQEDTDENGVKEILVKVQVSRIVILRLHHDFTSTY